MQVDEKLGSFKITGTLGVGAMGVVYKAVHDATGRPAAVKVVNKDIAAKGKTSERFQREAEILKQFRHQNIVRFYAVGRFQGTSYIAMEFVQGKTLEQLLEDRGAMPWEEVVDLGAQLCDALQYAHDHGVVHRDLKPSNLMITEDNRVKLTDFGIAKDLDKTALTATGRTLGTAAYMAPEQIRGAPEVSHKTDLYSLGCVLYQMLTGQAPFSGATHVVLMHCHLNEPAPRPSAKVAEIPKALDALVVQLMSKSPTDRPWDAAVVAAALGEMRDKFQKGEAIGMVWPTANATAMSTAALPTGIDTGASSSVVKKSKKKKSRSSTFAGEDDPATRRRKLLEIGGLVLALALVGGLIAYIIMPPGQEYLFQHAEKLMASTDMHDWRTARDEYLDPLDRRFPDNPHKKVTREWRDKVLVSEIEGRSKMLQSEANTGFNRPSGDIELRWVEYSTRVAAAQKRHDDGAALRAWEELAAAYRPEDSAERAWHLLAIRRRDEVKKAMTDRRELVLRQVAHAQQALQHGNAAEAEGLWKELLARYGDYPDLADLLSPQLAPGITPAAPSVPVPAPEADKGEKPEKAGGSENP
jgi:eukaryotic-like serine/threonine-protein kinase